MFDEHTAALKRLAVSGGHLAYLDVGPVAGPPVLLLHGIPTSSWLYRTIAARLAADGLRAVAPDLLGFGASDKPAGRDLYAARQQADRLLTLVDHLGLSQVTLVVHDAGGPWGFELVDRHPERVAGLVVLNTTAYADAFTPPRDIRALGGPLGPAMLAMMRSPLGRPMVHKMVAGFTHAGKSLDPAVTEPHWLALRDGGTTALRAFAQDLPAFTAEFPRYAAALRRLDAPAAVVWGTHDPVLRADRLVQRFVDDLRLDAADVHLLDGASHFLQEDRPDDIAELVQRFVVDRVVPGLAA
ncbi:alpha/beta fold hydrolase [Cellulomonas sp. URHD0024]|uniref:alpha/beta fold hydrolase n=1 Tax=Cellulomonas sp. URHD0024 TaxID=1302620 RepID=UPI000420D8B7|nr:alpha/beta fold hydrolase [Cellulomonas sp. URHD0024]